MAKTGERTLYWSHLKAYEECPQKCFWTYGWGDHDLGRGPGKGKPKPLDKSMHHAVMGIVIQGVLEDFYNDELWRNKDGLSGRLVRMTKERLTDTLPRFYIDWNDAPSLEEMESVCVDGVLGYLKTMKHHKLLGPYAKSEVEIGGQATDRLPVAGRADFIVRRDDTGTTLLDGKNSGTKMKWVDPDQLRWYALCFSLEYRKMPDRLGFVWFRYPHDPEAGEEGIDWIDFTKRDLESLVGRAKVVRRGQQDERFDARPSYKVCRFCDFESVCPERQKAKAENAAKRRRKKEDVLPVIDENHPVVTFGFNTE